MVMISVFTGAARIGVLAGTRGRLPWIFMMVGLEMNWLRMFHSGVREDRSAIRSCVYALLTELRIPVTC
jgi:hypothetical protein